MLDLVGKSITWHDFMEYFSQISTYFPFNKKNKRYNQIKSKLFNGNFSDADKLLNEIDNHPNKSKFDAIQIVIYKSTILLGQGDTQKSLEYVDVVLQSCSGLKNPLLLAETYLTKSFVLFEMNEIGECKTNNNK